MKGIKLQKMRTNNELVCGIHTVSIISDTPVTDEIEGVSLSKTNYNKLSEKMSYSIFINPNKYINTDIYSYQDFCLVLKEIIEKLEIKQYQLSRVDIKLDSFTDNYSDLFKMNKLLVLLTAIVYNLKNRYESIDPLTFDKLTIRAQNEYMEAENYNKAIQSNYRDKAHNRLELRSKALSKSKKDIPQLIEVWNGRLNILPKSYDELQKLCNDELIKLWLVEREEKVKSMSEFLRKYQSNVYTSKQLINLLARIDPSIPKSSAYKFKDRNSIEFITPKNLAFYISSIQESMDKFMTNKGNL